MGWSWFRGMLLGLWLRLGLVRRHIGLRITFEDIKQRLGLFLWLFLWLLNSCRLLYWLGRCFWLLLLTWRNCNLRLLRLTLFNNHSFNSTHPCKLARIPPMFRLLKPLDRFLHIVVEKQAHIHQIFMLDLRNELYKLLLHRFD